MTVCKHGRRTTVVLLRTMICSQVYYENKANSLRSSGLDSNIYIDTLAKDHIANENGCLQLIFVYIFFFRAFGLVHFVQFLTSFLAVLPLANG